MLTLTLLYLASRFPAWCVGLLAQDNLKSEIVPLYGPIREKKSLDDELGTGRCFQSKEWSQP